MENEVTSGLGKIRGVKPNEALGPVSSFAVMDFLEASSNASPSAFILAKLQGGGVCEGMKKGKGGGERGEERGDKER